MKDPIEVTERALQLAEEGETNSAVALLKAAFSETDDKMARLAYAMQIASTMIMSPAFVSPPDISWKQDLEHYARIAAKEYEECDEEVRELMRQSGVNIDMVLSVAAGHSECVRNLARAQELNRRGEHVEAIRLLKLVLNESHENRDRLFAAGVIVSTIAIAYHGESLPASQKSLEHELLKYAKVAVECYDKADPGTQQAFRDWGTDIEMFRMVLSVAARHSECVRNLARAQELNRRGEHVEAIRLLKLVLNESQENRDRLFAAGVIVSTIAYHGESLPASQKSLERELLKHAKVAVECYDKADPGTQQAFRDWGTDIEMVRRVVQSGSLSAIQRPASKSGCFIATAACGTEQAPDVVCLRAFRDGVLLQSQVGRLLVSLYYRVSPPVARIIAKSSPLRLSVRALFIKPTACLCRIILQNGSSGQDEMTTPT